MIITINSMWVGKNVASETFVQQVIYSSRFPNKVSTYLLIIFIQNFSSVAVGALDIFPVQSYEKSNGTTA